MTLSGADLRAARKATGMNQTQVAAKAGVGRQAVSYWERKEKLDHRGWAVRRMAAVLFLDLPINETSIARAGGWGDSPAVSMIEVEVARSAAKIAEWERTRNERIARSRRVTCGAKTRKNTPCRNMSEPGRGRCKFHGGMSTGARTPEGIARIVEAQRRRWSRYRAEEIHEVI